ncbi:MAG: hypothetical protein HZC28_07310 [Spirochaetes bacterium]|nr:hypothetical protein [Spirochaetota bacterium]
MKTATTIRHRCTGGKYANCRGKYAKNARLDNPIIYGTMVITYEMIM